MIAIIDYGLGNISSIKNILSHIGNNKTIITKDYKEINNADKIILPGVGSFDNGIVNLEKLNLINILNEKVIVKQTPVLGICLGMQLMTNNSSEGVLNGLGWINANTVRFSESINLKIPHMGWNFIKIKKSNPLINNHEMNKFYFVHSYYVQCMDAQDILATTEYGTVFTSSFQKNNIFGVQFHPEKSHRYGMSLFRNFINL